MRKKRLFVDMDGTLAEWQRAPSLETLYERGYFSNLRPQEAVVEAVRQLARLTDIEVYILSAVLSDSAFARQEKMDWLSRELPEIPAAHRLFPPCGRNKAEFLPGGCRETDFLLDDYTKNLREWGGVGIKCLNGQNGSHDSWKGSRISAFASAQEILIDLEEILSGAVIRHPVPAPVNPRDILCASVTQNDYRIVNGCGEMLLEGSQKDMGRVRLPLAALLQQAHLIVCWDWLPLLLAFQEAGVQPPYRPLVELKNAPEGVRLRTPTQEPEKLLKYYWQMQYPAAPKDFVPEGTIVVREMSEDVEPEMDLGM